jgi:hypothetical protein
MAKPNKMFYLKKIERTANFFHWIHTNYIIMEAKKIFWWLEAAHENEPPISCHGGDGTG